MPATLTTDAPVAINREFSAIIAPLLPVAENCNACGGTGTVTYNNMPKGPTTVTCPWCNGSGQK